MKIAKFLIAVAFLTGCATEDFTPYRGAQQNWPTAPGAAVKTRYAVPVYYGLPDRPYTVLGYLETGNTRSTGQNLAYATKKAKSLGGDAVILGGKQSSVAGYYNTAQGSAVTTGNVTTGFATGISMPIRDVESTVTVIKFR